MVQLMNDLWIENESQFRCDLEITFTFSHDEVLFGGFLTERWPNSWILLISCTVPKWMISEGSLISGTISESLRSPVHPLWSMLGSIHSHIYWIAPPEGHVMSVAIILLDHSAIQLLGYPLVMTNSLLLKMGIYSEFIH